MEKPYGRVSPDRRVLGLVNNNNNIYSPTDNLHLLTSVASELADSADRARKLRLQSKSSSRRNSDFRPRKDKSLGILCDKFLAMFPLILDDDYPSLEISLDKVANQLGIVKRRIYDIINILESLHMTSRVAKNRYEWHGDRNLRPVLSHLKRLAYQYGLDAKMQEVQVQQKALQSRSTTSSSVFTCGCSDQSQATSSSLPFDSENFFHDERTLGIMCQKFIMLFLVTEEGHAINLDVATQMLVNSVEKPAPSQQPSSSDGTPPACSCQPRHKTKVRRLYDIANVLTSLGLIRKERYNLSPVRKPVFVYNGPSFDEELPDMPDFCGSHTMRNSLLMVPVNEGREASFAHGRNMRLYRKRKDQSTLGPAEKLFCSSSEESNDARPVTRLGSLEDILRVAEQEFKLLMSGESSGETSMSFSCAEPTKEEEFDLRHVKEEFQVKEEPVSDDESIYPGPSSSFESYRSALTHFSDESEPKFDCKVKEEFSTDETEVSHAGTSFFGGKAEFPSIAEAETTRAEAELPVTKAVHPIAEMTPSVQNVILPVGQAIHPIAETTPSVQNVILPVGQAVHPIAETTSSVQNVILPVGQAVHPIAEMTLPVQNVTLPIREARHPIAETTLPVRNVTLPTGETLHPIAEATLPVQNVTLPTGETFHPIAETTLPIQTVSLPVDQAVHPVGETVPPLGSPVLPKFTLTEAPLAEVKTVERSTQMVNVKVVTGHSGDATHSVQKMPSFSYGPVAPLQSGNDQLAIGKVKRFTVTRKLIPSHFVLQKDPSNNLKLTLHHSPGVKGLIRLKPVSSSPKLCLPVTCIKTLKTINVVKAAPAPSGIPRTVEIKKRIHLVPMNSANPKGNFSVVQ